MDDRVVTAENDWLLLLPSSEKEVDVLYLPLPNVIDAVISDQVAPSELNPTAFVFSFEEDGSVVLARNRRRGAEVPGGHRENDETAEQTAMREALEEIGCIVSDLKPIGMFRSRVYAGRPAGYRYPYPVSCQQFFVGRVIEKHPYAENDECIAPISLPPSEAEKGMDARTLVLFREAVKAFDQMRQSAPRP